MHGAYLPKKPRRVLILGSGALQIGQAGEFDYSGSQAIKALREEGIRTVLINPNIATIQTSEGFADKIYLAAVTTEFVERVIEQEEVDAILLSFGGQTALNCGVELEQRGVLERHGVRVLGTPVKSILDTEDRQLFKDRLDEIDVKTARSFACDSIEVGRKAVAELGLPVMLRGAFALGGKGSAVVRSEEDVEPALRRAFDQVPQVLVEEYLGGWKEIEYEVVRDGRNNCITVCNMENFDPMGIHTGESIVVAPSQTLNDEEYQLLRTIAIKVIRHLGIVGECNIQYALDPNGTDYRVIEVNARLSRSSALASKATGYPLAYVAAKIALGFTLPEIPNGITRRTTAFFEPALDYLVCKFPRWDLAKFKGASTRIGSEMKSVGEVMAIGRTFPEVIQKAVRMLDIGVDGVDPDAFVAPDVRDALENPTPARVFSIARAFKEGMTVEQVHALTRIDRWFLNGLKALTAMDTELRARVGHELDPETMRRAKQLGFSDKGISKRLGIDQHRVRKARVEADVRPHIAKIDTLAAEFPAETNYLYSTYHAGTSESAVSKRKNIMVLGSGTYRIGSSVEFDWCCVNAAQAAAELGYETIMLNYNPETVSTDYDVCDKLVFDEVSFESVMDVYEREQPDGVVVSMGGQVPNNLAIRLHQAGVKILGTHAEDIDNAEDRSRFSSLLDRLGIDQPAWAHLTEFDRAMPLVEKLGGFPVLVRPSYVLSGAAMSVAHEKNELVRILERAKAVSSDHPVVMTAFEHGAREIEIDAVADRGEMVLVGHLRARGGCRRALRRCHADASAPVGSDSRDSQGAKDRVGAGPCPPNHRALQCPDAGQEGRSAGDRVQSARISQLAFRLQGHRQQLCAGSDASHAQRARTGRESRPRPGLCGREGSDVLVPASGGGRPAPRGRDGEHRRGGMFRRRCARSASSRAPRDGISLSQERCLAVPRASDGQVRIRGGGPRSRRDARAAHFRDSGYGRSPEGRGDRMYRTLKGRRGAVRG